MSDEKKQVSKDNLQFGAAVVHEDKAEREDMLKELFTGFSEAQKKTKAEVAATTGGEGWSGYESRAPLLQKQSADATSTLTERVSTLFGRR
jgi:hypothetical protein